MSRIKQVSLIVSAAFGFLIFACGPSTPEPTTPGTDPYGAYYPPPACDPSQPGCAAPAPGYAPTPGYAPPGYPAQPPPGYPPQPAPAPAATMSVPGPFAIPCQNDSACLTARCNLQYQKCVFPCQTPGDCAPGATCNAVSGLCLPGG